MDYLQFYQEKYFIPTSQWWSEGVCTSIVVTKVLNKESSSHFIINLHRIKTTVQKVFECDIKLRKKKKKTFKMVVLYRNREIIPWLFYWTREEESRFLTIYTKPNRCLFSVRLSTRLFYINSIINTKRKCPKLDDKQFVCFLRIQLSCDCKNTKWRRPVVNGSILLLIIKWTSCLKISGTYTQNGRTFRD